MPWINLTKEVKHLYPENGKTLIKQFEQDTNKWKEMFSPGWKN